MVLSSRGDAGAQREHTVSRGQQAITIIILCAVAVAAVVLVHKESAVSDADEVIVGAERDFDELMLFQHHEKKSQKESSSYRHQQLVAGETIHLEKDSVPDPSPVSDPVVKAKAPVHASLRTGHLEHYGQDDYDSNVVGAAGQKAAKALKEGKPMTDAYKAAQEAATDAVVGTAAKKTESPAFSQTIKAAAYAAEMKALKQLEAGQSEEAAKKAAREAAHGLINDDRAVEMTVPVPSSLSQLLSNVDLLWSQMTTKMTKIADQVKDLNEAECAHAKESVNAMQMAVSAAGEHITKSHQHKEVMETNLLQADQHEAHLQVLASDPMTELLQQKLSAINAEATQSKQASAEHHEHAKKQAHLAEGFLALAAKHHSAATDASMRCKALHVVHKFGYAQKQLKAFEAKHREEAMEKAAKDAAKKKAESLASRTATLMSEMRKEVPQEMQTAAMAAAKAAIEAPGGNADTAKAAAEATTAKVMKTVAKKLATDMSAAAIKSGEGPQGKTSAMKKAILAVIEQARPIQGSVVSAAVQNAVDWHLKQHQNHFGRTTGGPLPPVAPPAEATPVARRVSPAMAVPPSESPATKPVDEEPAVHVVKKADEVNAASKILAAKKARAQAEKVAEEVKAKEAKEADQKKVLKKQAEVAAVKKKIAQKSAKENTEKKAGKAKKASAEKAAPKKADEEAKKKAGKKAEKKADKEASKKADKEAAKKAEDATKKAAAKEAKKAQALAETAAGHKVVRAAKQAVKSASKSVSVQDAAKAMSAAVTRATAKAAEDARAKVEAAGGSMEEQLKAAQVAAAKASKDAAAAAASKLRKTAQGVVQAKVVKSATKVSQKEGKHVAQIGGTQTAAVEGLLQTAAVSGSMQMRRALVKTAKAVTNMAHFENKKAAITAMRKAMHPIVVKEVNRVASSAAATAGVEAKSQGMDAAAAKRHIMTAAKQAAQQAKATAVRLSTIAVRKALAN